MNSEIWLALSHFENLLKHENKINNSLWLKIPCMTLPFKKNSPSWKVTRRTYIFPDKIFISPPHPQHLSGGNFDSLSRSGGPQ